VITRQQGKAGKHFFFEKKKQKTFVSVVFGEFNPL